MTGEARKREREGCKTCERKRDERLGFDAWVYTCVCTRCQLREGRTEKERERDDDAIPAGGWRRVGGECQDSGGGGLEFPLLYAVDFAFEWVAGSTTSLRPTTVCRLSGVDLPGGCEYDLFRGSRRFIGA